jgi:hypothetical protein
LLTQSEARLRGRIGAYALHAAYDSRVVTQPARVAAAASLDARLLAEIDERSPSLPEAERLRRLEYARKAHFQRLALASAKARRAKAGGHA